MSLYTAVISDEYQPLHYFNIDNIVTSLSKINIRPKDVHTIQRMRHNLVEITVYSQEHFELLLSKGLTFGDRHCVLYPKGRPIKRIYVRWLPYDFLDEDLIDFLNKFGRVTSSVSKETNQRYGFYTGNRIVSMLLDFDIPHVCEVMDNVKASFTYNDQPEVSCESCMQFGHFVRNCPHKVFCSICRSHTHAAQSCPKREDNSRQMPPTAEASMSPREEEEDMPPLEGEESSPIADIVEKLVKTPIQYSQAVKQKEDHSAPMKRQMPSTSPPEMKKAASTESLVKPPPKKGKKVTKPPPPVYPPSETTERSTKTPGKPSTKTPTDEGAVDVTERIKTKPAKVPTKSIAEDSKK